MKYTWCECVCQTLWSKAPIRVKPLGIIYFGHLTLGFLGFKAMFLLAFFLFSLFHLLDFFPLFPCKSLNWVEFFFILEQISFNLGNWFICWALLWEWCENWELILSVAINRAHRVCSRYSHKHDISQETVHFRIKQAYKICTIAKSAGQKMAWDEKCASTCCY